MRQRLGLKRHEIEEPPINLTALIDVVFVILIMFILIAPLVEMENIELAQAGANTQSVQSQSDVNSFTLQVSADNSVRVQGTLISLEKLEELLKRLKEKQPKGKLRLIHDRKASFGTYQAIKNAAESAGFEEMELILKPS